MKYLALIFPFFLLTCATKKQPTGRTLSPATPLETVEDYQKVYAAINDYVEAIYLVQPQRIEKSVDTTLSKVGYYYNEEQGKYLDNLPMTYAQLYSLAANWNSEGDAANEKSTKIIEVFEVNDKTASGKLTAAWGIDYFHLAKVNGTWKIRNIIWQSPPR